MAFIKIWTDGSYRGKVGGICFYVDAPDVLEKPILVYSCIRAKRSTQPELVSIISAIKYLYYLQLDLSKCKIKIFCDESSIVEAFNGKRYSTWEEKGWRKGNGNPIKSSINQWFYLTCLVKSIQDGNIEFVKVVSRKDRENKLVDKYANYARNLKQPAEEQYVISEYNESKNECTEKEVLKSIDSDKTRQILNMETPWIGLQKSKWVRWNYKDEEIVYINPIKIVIAEDVHLDCKMLKFSGMIRDSAEKQKIKMPIAVRKEGDLYILISGITRLITAKLLNLSEIPCLILDMKYSEFIEMSTGAKK